MEETATGPDLDSAFIAMVDAHWPSMVRLGVRLCGRTDGEDVAQDALTAAWRLRDRFDSERGSARTWLLMLTADHARRHARRRLTRREVPASGLDVEVSAAQVDVDLRRAVAQLSERQQLAVTLFYYLDLPIAEVSTVMRCSAGTVKSTLADARRRLHGLLDFQEDS